MHMPGMTGIEFAKRIKGFGCQSRVFLLTAGGGDEEEVQRCLDEGILEGIVLKPLTRAFLR